MSNHHQAATTPSSKIKEIGGALIASGITALDEQAKVLGVARSTAWTIVKGHYKYSGLSPRTVNRMLSAPRLPPLVRAKILEYVDERRAGQYGDNKTRLRRFTSHLRQLDSQT